MAGLEKNRELAIEKFRSAQRFGSCTPAQLLGSSIRAPILGILCEKRVAIRSYGMRGSDLQNQWFKLVELAGSRPDSLGFIERKGNLKNFYANLKSGAKIKFSVPNAIDTSSITSGSKIVLGFESSKSIILPKAPLAID